MSLESQLDDYWNQCSPLTTLVTGGLWRDDIPQVDEDGEAIDIATQIVARFQIIAEVPTEIFTKIPTEERHEIEDRTIQIDLFGTDPDNVRQAQRIAKTHLNRWRPTLVQPEYFMQIDRTNSSFGQDPDEFDGLSVYHAMLEYTVRVQTEE